VAALRKTPAIALQQIAVGSSGSACGIDLEDRIRCWGDHPAKSPDDPFHESDER
jgi:hypothetical protein